MQIMDFSSTDCKNCYKCVRTCSVKAIKIKNQKAKIVEQRCIACGHCLTVCPQNARDVKSHIKNVEQAIVEGRKVVVSLAPSYKAYFNKSVQFVAALRKLGFTQIEETSIGAEIVSKEYEKYIRNSEQKELITTCCPSVVMLIEKYYPELTDNMIPVVSPMIAHGKLIKERDPKAYVVFIGPCISKICEAMSEEYSDVIDSVLTFDEIMNCLLEKQIDYKTLEPQELDEEGTLRGDQYPLVGGVLKGIKSTLDKRGMHILKAHGMDNSKQVLNALKDKAIQNVCIEMNICNESCIAGPGGLSQEGNIYTRIQSLQTYFMENKSEGKAKISKYLLSKESKRNRFIRRFRPKAMISYVPTEEEIAQALESMGKYTKEDELNCGTCGYDTCRDKAAAVINGMSQIDMCLPYTRSIAERLSNEIFHNSLNGILIINSKCEIVDMNPMAEEMFHYSKKDAEGKDISVILNRTPFAEALDKRMSLPKEKVELMEYGLIVYRDIIYLEKQKALLIILVNITQEERRKKEMLDLKENMIDVTQAIVDKQMRAAQEIASLLGETTAETKVAIMKLKKVLKQEGDY